MYSKAPALFAMTLALTLPLKEMLTLPGASSVTWPVIITCEPTMRPDSDAIVGAAGTTRPSNDSKARRARRKGICRDGRRARVRKPIITYLGNDGNRSLTRSGRQSSERSVTTHSVGVEFRVLDWTGWGEKKAWRATGEPAASAEYTVIPAKRREWPSPAGNPLRQPVIRKTD